MNNRRTPIRASVLPPTIHAHSGFGGTGAAAFPPPPDASSVDVPIADAVATPAAAGGSTDKGGSVPSGARTNASRIAGAVTGAGGSDISGGADSTPSIIVPLVGAGSDTA